MSTNAEPAQLPRCPQCHEPIRPGTAFCGNCGTSVSEITNVPPVEASNDAEATASFVPVSGDTRDADTGTAREPSPWAPPNSSDYAPPTTVSPSIAGARAQTETGTGYTHARQQQGIRGMLLGIVAVILIGAVFALYLYDAWLSESAQSTVEGWLPWLS